MTGGPARSTDTQGKVPSCPAPAAVPEQRRRSATELHRIQRLPDSQRMSPGYRRLTCALLLSLLIHTLLLGLTFGGRGRWLPGFGFPWQDRRIEAPDLRVVVVSPQVTAAEPAVTPVAEPLQQAQVEQKPVASGPALTPSMSRAPTPPRTAAAIMPEANPRAEANPRTDAATGAAPAQTPLRGDWPGDTAPLPIPAPAVIALARTDVATWVVPTTPAMPTPVIAAAPSASIPETAMPSLRDAGDAARAPIEQEARERAVELAKLDPFKQEGQRQAADLQEAARLVAARQQAALLEGARLEADLQEAARRAADLQEAARQAALRQEAARVEAARVEAARVEAAQAEAARVEVARAEGAQAEAARAEAARAEAARAEAARVEAARVEAARAEAARAEAARVEAARVEAARVEAARVEAARAEAARAEAARAEAARVEAARVELAQDAAARREAALRAIGRQLDEEAARREAATAAARVLHPRGAAHVDTGYWVALTPTRNSSCTRKPGPGRSS